MPTRPRHAKPAPRWRRALIAAAAAVTGAALVAGGTVAAAGAGTSITQPDAKALWSSLGAYLDQPAPTVTETVTVTAPPVTVTATPTPSTASPTPTASSSSSTPAPTATATPPAAAGRYTPPQLTNPVTIQIAATGGTYSAPATTDCLFIAPQVITGPVTIAGCDDRVFRGGILAGRTTIPTGSYDSPNRGIRLSDSGSSNTGRDHFEGLWFKPGTYLSDAIQIAFRSTTGRTVTLQNIRVDATTYGSKAGVHADTLQVWGGPSQLRVWGLVATDSRYQGAYLDPADGRSLPAQSSGWEFGNVSITMTGPNVSYALTQREPAWAGTKNVGPVYTVGQRYKANNDPGYTSWPTANLFESQVPAVDFVPAAWWATGSYLPAA